MEKSLLQDCRLLVRLAVLMVCALGFSCVYAQAETVEEATQPKIKLADPNKELTQLELFKVDELFGIVEEMACFKGQRWYNYGADDFKYQVWGRSSRNAMVHLAAQFPYAYLIPRYRKYYAGTNARKLDTVGPKSDETDTWLALISIDSKEAMEVIVDMAASCEKITEDSYIWLGWHTACVILEEAPSWNEDKYALLAPRGTPPKVWWDAVKEKWSGHPTYRVLEEALQVMLDKSLPEKERERAGDFVMGVVCHLPLASVLPYVEPIARDTSEPYRIRAQAMGIMRYLRTNDVVPVFIDLLCDLTVANGTEKYKYSIADHAYSALTIKTGVGDCYKLVYHHALATNSQITCFDAEGLPLTLREIVALDLCPCTMPPRVTYGYWLPLSTLTEADRLRLQENWRYFWEKMKGWILVR